MLASHLEELEKISKRIVDQIMEDQALEQAKKEESKKAVEESKSTTTGGSGEKKEVQSSVKAKHGASILSYMNFFGGVKASEDLKKAEEAVEAITLAEQEADNSTKSEVENDNSGQFEFDNSEGKQIEEQNELSVSKVSSE